MKSEAIAQPWKVDATALKSLCKKGFISMYRTQSTSAIATTASCCNYRVKTPQRKANYKDKTRIRLKDLKDIAFRKYGVNSTAEIKQLLVQLKIKLDLRLSSAWDAICFELKSEILDLPRVGSKVVWINAPVYVQTWWQWMTVKAIVGNRAVLDMWNGDPVPLSELELYKEELAIAA